MMIIILISNSPADMLPPIAPTRSKLPVTIVTGFLGSGKTTLLNYIISNFEGYRVGVLVNEFGDINIDNQLLVSIDEDIAELSNGCICCTINDDFNEAIYRLLSQRDRIDYLVVETTGIADPLRIALTFLGSQLRDFTHLDAIVTLIDADTFDPKIHYNTDVAIAQIFCGDIILLNKIDLVTETSAIELEKFLLSVKDGARILRTSHAQVQLSLLLGVELANPDLFDRALAAEDREPTHLDRDGFMSVSFQSDRPFSLKKFQQFLDDILPENVFRAKGILWFDESPRRHIFQLSGKRFSIDDSKWETAPKNQMVFIGRGLDKLYLLQSLTNCLTFN